MAGNLNRQLRLAIAQLQFDGGSATHQPVRAVESANVVDALAQQTENATIVRQLIKHLNLIGVIIAVNQIVKQIIEPPPITCLKCLLRGVERLIEHAANNTDSNDQNHQIRKTNLNYYM
jgi:hypothetical protein